MTEPNKIRPVQPVQQHGSEPAAPAGGGGSGGGNGGLVEAMVTRATTAPDYSIERTEIRAMTERLMLKRQGELEDYKRAIQQKGGVLFALRNAERKERLTNG